MTWYIYVPPYPFYEEAFDNFHDALKQATSYGGWVYKTNSLFDIYRDMKLVALIPMSLEVK